jgi:hypothetical protein
MRDPMEVEKPWDVSDNEFYQCVGDLTVTMGTASTETPNPLDLTLWTLLREADALTLGLSIGAFHPTLEQRRSLTALIEQLQRAQSLAIDAGV